MKFKVGDRVRVIKNAEGAPSAIIGDIGTIKHIDNHVSHPVKIAVEFDNERLGYHTCGSLIGHNKGYWCSAEMLEKVNNESIVIYRKDNKVIALDKSTGKKAEAKCNTEDTFDFKTGAKVAFERLMSEVTFRALCVKDYKVNRRTVFEKGKVYEWINGTCIRDDGSLSREYDSFEELLERNPLYTDCLVELKEGDDPAEVLKKYEKIKVGDIVTVVDNGRQYTSYSEFFAKNRIDYDKATRFAYNKPIENGGRYKVVAIGKHHLNDKILCVIQNEDEECYLINTEGVEKC